MHLRNGLGLFLEGFLSKAKKFNNKERASDPRLWGKSKVRMRREIPKGCKVREYSFSQNVLERLVGGLTLRERSWNPSAQHSSEKKTQEGLK